jgi:hypothetical protein
MIILNNSVYATTYASNCIVIMLENHYFSKYEKLCYKNMKR